MKVHYFSYCITFFKRGGFLLKMSKIKVNASLTCNIVLFPKLLFPKEFSPPFT